MEIDSAFASPHSALSHRISLITAREQGISAAQIRLIGTDPDLFEIFYREQLEDLKRFIARRIGERERIADLTAETFIAAIEAAPRFGGRATPKTWLYGIARNVIANDARSANREQTKQDRFRGSTPLDQDEAELMVARIDAGAQSRTLYAAISRLPKGERAVLELVAIDELSVAEAAAALRVRTVTARVRLHRARRALRDRLDQGPSHLGAAPKLSAIKNEEEKDERRT